MGTPLRPPMPPSPPTEVLGGPPKGPRRPWWQHGWGAALVGVVGLILGAAIGASGGKGSTSTVTTEGAAKTVQVGQAPTHTVTITHVVVHNQTRPVTAPAPESSGGGSSGGGSSGGGSSGGGGGQSYSGDGTKNLGTVTISQPSTLHWTAGGGFFGITGATSGYEHTIAISSQASSGESAVEPGTYKEVNVLGQGGWSITISPG
jgi:hypothetical protein